MTKNTKTIRNEERQSNKRWKTRFRAVIICNECMKNWWRTKDMCMVGPLNGAAKHTDVDLANKERLFWSEGKKERKQTITMTSRSDNNKLKEKEKQMPFFLLWSFVGNDISNAHIGIIRNELQCKYQVLGIMEVLCFVLLLAKAAPAIGCHRTEWNSLKIAWRNQ